VKVLIIPSWYPNINNNIVGSFFQEQADLLASNGYDVKILYGNIATITTVNYLKNKFRNLFVSKKSILQNDYLIQKPQAFSFAIFQWWRWSEEEKHKVMCGKYIDAYKELLESGWKPDLIHAQCTVDAGIIAEHLSALFKIPFVIIEHQVFLLNNYSKFKQNLIINSLQRANKVGAVSNHQKRCILMNSIKCDPFIIWNFVNEEEFTMIPLESNLKFRILTISYPNYIKDMDTFFKSISSFCKMGIADIEVVVIGNNSFSNLQDANTVVFESFAKKYDVTSYCLFIPFLPRNEISKILNTANVFISTSIAETFGVAVREAMLCGIPVIATKSGGVEDSINKKTGIKVDIGDYQAIADALFEIKNGTLEFDSEYIRKFAISQCGKTAFMNKMNLFYSI
jgi:glycosyltransferase involved in cell wall biosynthesis